MQRAGVRAAVVATLCLAALVALATRRPVPAGTSLDWLEGYEWEPPYPGAGPETPEWERTPASVGQGALDAFDPSHAESNVLGNDYKYPDYARGAPRTGMLAQRPSRLRMAERKVGQRLAQDMRKLWADRAANKQQDTMRGEAKELHELKRVQFLKRRRGVMQQALSGAALQQAPAGTETCNCCAFAGCPCCQPAMPAGAQQLTGARGAGMGQGPLQRLWVGAPQKMLPPNGDYPGGATGIPMDGYLAYETGWANDGPFHGELAPLQEAGVADKAVPMALRLRGSGGGRGAWREGAAASAAASVSGRATPVLSIMDPGQAPVFDDWDLGNQAAPLDTTYDPGLWEGSTQPLDKYNLGKVTCVMGEDCQDATHQGGVHDNGHQLYDYEARGRGSIDPNSDRSVHDEYLAPMQSL